MGQRLENAITENEHESLTDQYISEDEPTFPSSIEGAHERQRPALLTLGLLEAQWGERG